MANRIEYLKIENFRGSTGKFEIEFDKSKPAVLIFGENASGKSTIVDALDFVCNKKYGSIEFVSAGSAKTSSLPAIGKSPRDIKVIIRANDKTYSATFSGKDINVSGDSVRPYANVLLRSTILNMITSQPNERYKALESFFSMPFFEKSENSVREAYLTINKKYEESVRAKEQAERELKRLWELEGSPDKSSIIWAIKQTNESSENLTLLTFGIKDILQKIRNYIISYEKKTTSETDYQKIIEDYEYKHKEFIKSQEGTVKDAELLINTLENSKDYISINQEIPYCPVCNQPIKTSELIQDIQSRLDNIKDLVRIKNETKEIESKLRNSKSVLDNDNRIFKATSEILANCIVSNTQENINIFSMDFEGLLDEIDDEILIVNAYKLKDKIDYIQIKLNKVLDDKMKSLNQMNALKNHINAINIYNTNGLKLQKQVGKLKTLLNVFESIRKNYVNNLLSEISTDVQNFYSKIHPCESLGNVKFSVKSNAKASIEFTGQFESKPDILPQIYYSESHLDTLGLSIFLALAKKYSDENSIVVLDDVISSVDQKHMRRIIDMISDEYENFNQLIITTHYRRWRDSYKRFSMLDKVQLFELLPWSIQKGISHSKTKIELDDLKDKLIESPLDRQAVASKAGIMLEALFDELALKYACKLPRNPENEYTLGEYLGSLSKIMKHLKIENYLDSESIELELSVVYGKISNLSWIRNQVGCHFNMSGYDTVDYDIKELGELTVEIIETIVCKECGEIPTRNKSGSYWECHCGKKRMKPLTNPN